MHNVQLQMRQGDTGPTGISHRFAQLNSPMLSFGDPGIRKKYALHGLGFQGVEFRPAVSKDFAPRVMRRMVSKMCGRAPPLFFRARLEGLNLI